MKVLFAAFEPFDGRTENRSLEAVKLVAARRLRGVEVRTLPVSFARLARLVPPLAEACEEALILVGESEAARVPTLERVALNLVDARIADNEGAQPRDARVVEGGPLAYEATWPARRLEATLRAAGLEVELSAHAGTYACNAALYLALHRAASLPRPPVIGFLHVPALPPFADDARAAATLHEIGVTLLGRKHLESLTS